MEYDPDWRRLGPEVLAVVVATAALGYALGPAGIAIGGAIAFVRVSTAPIYAFGVGQVLFVVFATAGTDGLLLKSLLVAEAGLGAVLLGALFGHWPHRTAVVSAGAFAVVTLGFASVYALETVWHGAAILAVAYGIVAYTLHRYELVRLGVIGETD